MTSSLEPRFLEPADWKWDSFTRISDKDGTERRLRFGYVLPQSGKPDGVVVCLPGLGEPSDKYFEVSRDITAKNKTFMVLDWVGHGKSSRHLPDEPFKRHSTGFDDDIKDLHQWLEEHVKPMAGDLPIHMLAHSMGGHLGVRYMLEHKDHPFKSATLSAPMFQIFGIRHFPFVPWIACKMGFGKKYAFGQNAFPKGKPFLSTDPIRKRITQQLFDADPSLAIKGATWKWLYEAKKSCDFILAHPELGSIQTPFTFAIAGLDLTVVSQTTRKIAAKLPNVRVIELKNAKHETLMETDEQRNMILDAVPS